MERGYRVWKIRFDDEGIPHLGSVSHTGYEWTPGENVSSLGPKEDISTSSAGFYSLATPRNVREAGYYPSSGRVLGEIIPYGRLRIGRDKKGAIQGYRSEKAEISTLFIGGEPCDLCGSKTGKEAKFFFTGEEGEDWGSCPDCIRKIKSVLTKTDSIKEMDLDDVRTRLYKRFGVNVYPIPPELLETRKSGLVKG